MLVVFQQTHDGPPQRQRQGRIVMGLLLAIMVVFIFLAGATSD